MSVLDTIISNHSDLPEIMDRMSVNQCAIYSSESGWEIKEKDKRHGLCSIETNNGVTVFRKLMRNGDYVDYSWDRHLLTSE